MLDALDELDEAQEQPSDEEYLPSSDNDESSDEREPEGSVKGTSKPVPVTRSQTQHQCTG